MTLSNSASPSLLLLLADSTGGRDTVPSLACASGDSLLALLLGFFLAVAAAEAERFPLPLGPRPFCALLLSAWSARQTQKCDEMTVTQLASGPL